MIIKSDKKLIVISAINLFEGGPLSILEDCICELTNATYKEFQIKILVHKIDLIKHHESENIEFIEFPKSRKSYFFRLYYEYFYFYNLSKKWDVHLWFSLHDISPIVKAHKQAVYCHNASIFRKSILKDIYYQPKIFLFSFLYKYLYKLNIKANTNIVLQSSWMRDSFSKIFSIQNEKIIVAKPISTEYLVKNKVLRNTKENGKNFFYPAFPRPFKNFEIIGDACEILSKKNVCGFTVRLTIDGSENNYSKHIYKKYNHLKNIEFIGLLSRDKVFEMYNYSDVLIFPSTLESWGLPLTEFKQYNKSILLIDLDYSHETLGNFQKVNFFKINDPEKLAYLMEQCVNNTIIPEGNKSVTINNPVSYNWTELFEILL